MGGQLECFMLTGNTRDPRLESPMPLFLMLVRSYDTYTQRRSKQRVQHCPGSHALISQSTEPTTSSTTVRHFNLQIIARAFHALNKHELFIHMYTYVYMCTAYLTRRPIRSERAQKRFFHFPPPHKGLALIMFCRPSGGIKGAS
jgi:hypothetical protein